MPFKSPEYFCKMADQDGVVISAGDKNIKVRYKDGEEVVYAVGTVYGFTEGVEYKHVLLVNVKEGERFKRGDALYYHRDFYEPDWLDPTRLVFKTNLVTTVAIMVNGETYEDSSAISQKLSKLITTEVLHERSVTLKFDANIKDVVKVGDKVEPDSSLYLDLGQTPETNNLNEFTVSLLESLKNSSPRAKHKGVIEKIEVKYNGDKADMSPSLAKLISKLDRELYNSTKGTEDEANNNRVTGEYVTKGRKLELDTLELKFSIAEVLDAGIGDKLAYGNQAKSVIGSVFTQTIVGDKSGDEIHSMFGYIGFLHRIIDSPFRMGTTNRVTRRLGMKLMGPYFK